MRSLIGTLMGVLACSGLAAAPLADEPPIRQGQVRFEPVPDEHTRVPELFRMSAATFDFQQRFNPEFSQRVSFSHVTFPSPVKTPHENNNTVHCEYFRPAAAGQYPGCVVLHILGGDFELSRTFANALAHRGVAALFVKMPYYGPRRQPDADVRMISRDPQQTVCGMTQAVKDIRWAAAWLAEQEEVRRDQLGVFGISLGGITATLAAAAEPRFVKVCPVLAGGDVQQVLSASEQAELIRRRLQDAGQDPEKVIQQLKLIDPVTHAPHLRGRRILMLNATRDEVIPRACTERLWKALGEPEIHWYPAGHVTAGLFLFDGLAKVTNFFQPDPE